MSNTTHDLYSLSEKMYSPLDIYGEVEQGTADSSSHYLGSSRINALDDQCSTFDSPSYIINELDITYPNDDHSTEETAKEHRFILDALDCSNINSTNMPFNEDFYPNASNTRGMIIFRLFYLSAKTKCLYL